MQAGAAKGRSGTFVNPIRLHDAGRDGADWLTSLLSLKRWFIRQTTQEMLTVRRKWR